MQAKDPPPPSLPPGFPLFTAEPALRVLMRRHGALVRGIAAGHEVPAPAVDAVVQVVVLVLWRVLQRGEAVVELEAWLAAVTKRVVWQQSHRDEPRDEVVGEVVLVDSEPTAEDLRIAMQSVDLIHDIARALDPGQRAVLLRHELNGEAMNEIAVSLTIRLNTAYNRLRLARAAFQKEHRRRRR